MKGSISSIETGSVVDGPGIRTVVFLNGCNKRCLYCHNPEMFKIKDLNYTAIDLKNKLIRYKNYYSNKGGITFSGGEPLLQTNFLIETCKLLKKENINIAIDTAGDYKGNINELLKYVDLILLDIKHVDDKEYFSLTKSKIKKQDEFIKIINKYNIDIYIRQVIVPGIHDNLDYLKKLKEYLKKINNIKDITFIPYHKLGIEKYKKLNLVYPLENVLEMNIDSCNKLYEEFKNLN